MHLLLSEFDDQTGLVSMNEKGPSQQAVVSVELSSHEVGVNWNWYIPFGTEDQRYILRLVLEA